MEYISELGRRINISPFSLFTLDRIESTVQLKFPSRFKYPIQERDHGNNNIAFISRGKRDEIKLNADRLVEF